MSSSKKQGNKGKSNANKRDKNKQGSFHPAFQSQQEGRSGIKRHGKGAFNKEGSPKKKNLPKIKRPEDGVRLNKYIANAGVCARREADELIKAGVVEVNGKIIQEMGYKVMPGDVVKCDGATLRIEKMRYVLLNKPKNFVTSLKDPFHAKTVMWLVKGACKERIFPVGRLDKETTGLLLFTNDGDLAMKLTHPSMKHKKIYHVQLDKKIKKEYLDEIKEGIELEDGFVKASDVSMVKGDPYQVGIEIHVGRNRIVRRIFNHFGYHVKKLDRVYFAGLTKKDLPRGKWRMLTEEEVTHLKNLR